MSEEAKLKVVLDAEAKGLAVVDQFEEGLKGVDDQAKKTSEEITKTFSVDDLVNEAVRGLDVASEAFDGQEAAVNRLAMAQHELEARALDLADAERELANNTDPAAQHDLEGAVLKARVALDDQNASVVKLARDHVELGQNTTESAGAFSKLSATFESITGVSLSTAVSIGAVIGVLKEGYEILDASVERFTDYTEHVRGLSNAYGLSAKQASTLLQVLDDARVKPESLETAMRSLVSKGVQPTVDNLARLADQFAEIDDPVERAAFVSDNFGQRAGPEMAKALALGGPALRQYAKDAEELQLTLSEADLAAAEKLKAAEDRMSDAQQRWDNSVGRWATEVWADVTNAAVDAWEWAGENFTSSQMSQYEWVQETGRAYAEMTGEAQRELNRLGDSTLDVAQDTEALAQELANAQKAYQEDLQTMMSGQVGKENKRHAETIGELTAKAEDLKSQLEELNRTNGQYYEYTTDSSLSTNELALAQYNLAEAQADLAKETDPGKQLELKVQIDGLQEKISGATTVVQGYVDNSKQIGELSGEYDEVTAAIGRENAAHAENTRAFMFNLIMKRASMDDFKTYSMGELGELAARWGLIDEDTAATMGIVDDAMASGKGDVNAAADYIDARVQVTASGVRIAMSDEAHDLETAKTRSSVLSGLITQYAHNTKADVGTATDDIEGDAAASKDFVASSTAIMDADMARSMGMAETLVSTLQQEIDGKTYHNYIVTHFVESYEGGAVDGSGGVKHKRVETTTLDGAVDGFSAGGSFIVPGSGRGDRPYTVPLEPGERVTVTPVNKVGGANAAPDVEQSNRPIINVNAFVVDDSDMEKLAYKLVNIIANRS